MFCYTDIIFTKNFLPKYERYLITLYMYMSCTFIHHVMCLVTSPQPPPKRFHHRVLSTVFSFKFQYVFFLYGHPVTAYVIFLVFSFFLSFLQ